MTNKKSKEVLDWYGNPIPGVYRGRGKSRLMFKVEQDADGKKYWRAYTADGKPGDRFPVDGPDAPARLRRERRWVRISFSGEFNAALVAPFNSAE
jgi:hypothetical protein